MDAAIAPFLTLNPLMYPLSPLKKVESSFISGVRESTIMNVAGSPSLSRPQFRLVQGPLGTAFDR